LVNLFSVKFIYNEFGEVLQGEIHRV